MTELEARNAIVFYCALLWQRGLVAGSSGNVSVLLDDGSIVVTPSGRSLRALSPGELVTVPANGALIGARARPTTELPLHLAAYRARPEIRCVVHTHPTHCVGWSKTGALFPLDTVGAMESLGPIAFTRYAKSGTRALAERCSSAFAAGHDTVLMERHGVSCVGATLEEAFVRTDLAEQTAHIEYVAKTLGVPAVPAGEDTSAEQAGTGS